MYATSTAQLVSWFDAWGLPAAPVAALPIETIAPGITTRGPALELAEEVRGLHARAHRRS